MPNLFLLLAAALPLAPSAGAAGLISVECPSYGTITVRYGNPVTYRNGRTFWLRSLDANRTYVQMYEGQVKNWEGAFFSHAEVCSAPLR